MENNNVTITEQVAEENINLEPRPESENLLPAISKILEGFNEFNNATKERIYSREYQEEHLDELNYIRKTFFDLELILKELEEKTL